MARAQAVPEAMAFAASCDQGDLVRIILENRLVTVEQLRDAQAHAQQSGESLAESLTRRRAVSVDDLLQALALHYDIPYMFRGELPIPAPIVPNVSAKYLRQYVVCPVSLESGVLTVATADPRNTIVLDDLRQSTGLQIRMVVSPPDAILEALERTYHDGVTPLQKIVEGMEDDRDIQDEEDVNQLRDMAFEAPVVRLVNLIVENAITAGASDVHVEPFEDTLRVRYRIDGMLFEQESPPRQLRDALTSRIKLMAEMNIAERRLPQDGRIRVSIRDRRVDIRVSTIPTVHGESIVMRLLDRQSVFVALDRLGLAPATLETFMGLITRPHGIFLVTGPTGSGKTTTLYAALDKINSPERKIITIEDPVEYQLKGVNQIPVKAKVGLTFATGLRHIVRQDPDVILVGEIRDLETVEIAIQASLTGHLVFSTLHTNDAAGAVPRLLDMGAEPYLIASVLDGVLAQRLVRRVCASCRVPETPSPGDLVALGVQAAAGVRLWRGKGCDECRGTGYRGRTGIYELFPITEDVRSLVLRRAPTHELRRHAVQAGMTTLRLDGWAKACQGVTTIEEVLRVTQEDA